MVFFFQLKDLTLTKIGQSPSLADLWSDTDSGYKAVLEEEKLRELKRAIGLSAHGVGIGAFVYLRRVFEYLVQCAHEAASTEDGWDEEQYAKSRIVDRIRGRTPAHPGRAARCHLARAATAYLHKRVALRIRK